MGIKNTPEVDAGQAAREQEIAVTDSAQVPPETDQGTDQVIQLYALPFDTAGWDFNDGKGLRTQKQCDKLADALEAYLTDNPPAGGIISVDLGLYVDEQGHLTETGTRSAHSTDLDHVRQFTLFLRSCGGFRIW